MTPEEPITEHEVFEVLKSSGAKIVLKTFYAIDAEGNRTDKISHQLYLWELFPKQSPTTDL